MPYAQGTRLPGESASKLGHLAVLQSDWVRALVTEFDADTRITADPSKTLWTESNTAGIEPLRNVWAVDGGRFVRTRPNARDSAEGSSVCEDGATHGRQRSPCCN